MGFIAYLKNQVEKKSRIDNSVKNQSSKISKSNISKAENEYSEPGKQIHNDTNKLILTVKCYNIDSSY